MPSFLDGVGVFLFYSLWPYLGVERTHIWELTRWSLYLLALGQHDSRILSALTGVNLTSPFCFHIEYGPLWLQSQNWNSSTELAAMHGNVAKWFSKSPLKTPPKLVQDFDSKAWLLGGTQWNKDCFLRKQTLPLRCAQVYVTPLMATGWTD